ncbi:MULTISPECIES: CfaE/CblD family pilus tip adhesin [Rahnella]|jgi:hypothetical protein|uniref:CfaE/CblD family pilus tip adhesin n=1 Tax=Rahnella TaxID=34037 RepID=UPI000BB18F1B|nr:MULTISPECIES: CfaE/CblD family pilus tip adhesin [Rahnella]VTQ53678.1 Colonization factor antigen I subunit E [Campylobacter jejuni]PBI81982.1 pilus assembly protein CblD [Rahnella victoriana]TBX32413.1 pilus assembly protein CblD [Rahnella victoriana]TDS86274.1 CblD-like pilus biogenesis initiator [Rahnella sp. BIGb0236]UHM91405.1 pilus assembly protein CblD [Rahnella victoriana]
MNLTKTYFIVALLIMVSGLTAQSTRAERVEPTGRDTPVTATFDKSSLPSQIDIWKNESGGYDTSNQALWGRNSWVCVSNSSPTNGQCATSPQWYGYGHTQVATEFKEQKSGLTQVINITAYHKSGDYDDLLSTAAAFWSGISETKESAFISSSELQKLPVGGIWKAELKMSLTQWDPRLKLADWNAHITLNVTDNNNQQIYLPEFGNAAPLVSLNMRPLPGTGNNKVSVTGTANIDVCLYDGYNANSSTFMLTLDDDFTGQSNRSGINFSIVRQGGDANNERDRMDYTINMLNPDTNTLQTVSRARQMNLTKIQQARIRQVHLPGIPEPVICVPAPLELSTGYLAVSSKNAGYYRGTLKLNFTTSLY